jgi:hypothetical protein
MDACVMINSADGKTVQEERLDLAAEPQKISKAKAAAVFALSLGFTAAVIGCAVMISKTLATR